MGNGVPLTAADLAGMAGGKVTAGDSAVVPTGFGIDSRAVGAGEAFFAIVAARNGHAFLGDAVARGAAVVVVSEPVAEAARGAATVVRVPNTTRALQDIARAVRRQSRARVVAITGSAGKTTTKEATAAMLEGRFTVVRNPGNLNNHLGLPLSLLELRHGADVAVMELGMNHAGEIRVLVGIAEPDVRVWTNVGNAHIGHFGTADAIARAKAEILEGARRDTLLVANADDERVMAHAGGFVGRVVTFGTGGDADVRAVDIVEEGLTGVSATIVTGSGRVAVRVPLPGRANLANVLCAAAVATELGVPLAGLPERIATLAPARHRGQVLRLRDDIVVVDDSYNSSPAALRQALELLGRQPAERRVAVLGEMLELGDRAIELHQASGRAAARARVGLLVAIGGEAAEALARAAVEAGLPAGAVRHEPTSEAAAAWTAGAIRPGDVVLVKGSRGIATERVVERLTAERG